MICIPVLLQQMFVCHQAVCNSASNSRSFTHNCTA